MGNPLTSLLLRFVFTELPIQHRLPFVAFGYPLQYLAIQVLDTARHPCDALVVIIANRLTHGIWFIFSSQLKQARHKRKTSRSLSKIARVLGTIGGPRDGADLRFVLRRLGHLSRTVWATRR